MAAAPVGGGSGTPVPREQGDRPLVGVTAPFAAVVEGDSATFTVTVSGERGADPVLVEYSVSGTAQAALDYTVPDGTTTIGARATEAEIAIATLTDGEAEQGETIVVTLESAATATGAGVDVDRTPATVNILPAPMQTGTGGQTNDTGERQEPVLAILDSQATEDAGSLSFRVLLARARGQAVTVSYRTEDGTATSGSGADYTSAAGELTFAPGEPVEQSLVVAVVDDGETEPEETFTVRLHTPVNAQLGDAEATGTIVDNDSSGGLTGEGTPTVDIGDSRAGEGDGTMPFTVTLSQATTKVVTVSYRTSHFRAYPPADYQHTEGTLTFSAGTLEQTFNVPIVQDREVESMSELFGANLYDPVNAVVGDGEASGVIVDDDDDHGNTQATASTVSPGTLITGRLESGEDVDVFKIAVPGDRTMVAASDTGKGGLYLSNTYVAIDTAGYTSTNQASFDTYDVGADTAYVRVWAPSGRPYELFIWLLDRTEDSDFDIELRYRGNTPTADQQAVIRAAADVWESVITGDLPRQAIVSTSYRCNRSDRSPFGLVVDDLLIHVRLTEIDGSGLGRGSPCSFRANGMPVIGRIEIDADAIEEVSPALLRGVVLHEMGHVLGFGSSSRWHNLLRDSARRTVPLDQEPADTYFAGTEAVSAFDELLGGNTYAGNKVPVENRFNYGGKDTHWRESVFGPELMTPEVDASLVLPLSKVTIAAMADLGYTVDYTQADDFTLPE